MSNEPKVGGKPSNSGSGKPTTPDMTPAAFTQWLADMKAAGIAPHDKHCAAALGITPNGLLRMKRQGATRQTALACAGLLAGLGAYGEGEKKKQENENKPLTNL